MLFHLPRRYAINPRSGRPEAPDIWRVDAFSAWAFRFVFALSIALFLIMYLQGRLDTSANSVITFALVALAVNEARAFALRKRKAEFAAALRDYHETLHRASN
jgi:hypothetical protein